MLQIYKRFIKLCMYCPKYFAPSCKKLPLCILNIAISNGVQPAAKFSFCHQEALSNFLFRADFPSRTRSIHPCRDKTCPSPRPYALSVTAPAAFRLPPSLPPSSERTKKNQKRKQKERKKKATTGGRRWDGIVKSEKRKVKKLGILRIIRLF